MENELPPVLRRAGQFGPYVLSALAGGIAVSVFPSLRRPIEAVLAPLLGPKHIQGTGHLVLNVVSPQTSWGNLGLWNVCPEALIDAWESGGSRAYSGLLSPRLSAAGRPSPRTGVAGGGVRDPASDDGDGREADDGDANISDNSGLLFPVATPRREPAAVPASPATPVAAGAMNHSATPPPTTTASLFASTSSSTSTSISSSITSSTSSSSTSSYAAATRNKADKTYAQACEDLAILLAEAARVEPGDTVADCGFGCGDQAVLWAQRYALAAYVGFNPCVAQCETAARLCSRAAATAGGGTCTFDLVPGPASLLADRAGSSFDRVLSLDAAYHFDTRAAFLRDAFAALRPGGTLAVADIVSDAHRLPLNPFARLFLRLALSVSSVPLANYHDCVEYRRVLEALGFQQVSIRVIDEFVFAPFAEHIASGAGGVRDWVDPFRWARFAGAARAIRWAAGGKVHFVIVTATKPLLAASA
jgi:ubiquinone/menaquinone biosynthesis C-methylase UbiE